MKQNHTGMFEVQYAVLTNSIFFVTQPFRTSHSAKQWCKHSFDFLSTMHIHAWISQKSFICFLFLLLR